MNAIVQFILKHGCFILFAAMFAHQIGFPVPGPLFLLAGGALAAVGKLGLIPALVGSVIACVMADWVWYEAGRHRGIKVLHFIHRLSRDPDFHDRRAQQTFARYGSQLILVAKFVPGLDAVTPPLAGISRTGRVRFLAYDTLGAGLYSCVYSVLGYVFSHDLDRAAAYVVRAGKMVAAVAVAGLCIFVLRKVMQYRSTGKSHLSGSTLSHATAPCATLNPGTMLKGAEDGDQRKQTLLCSQGTTSILRGGSSTMKSSNHTAPLHASKGVLRKCIPLTIGLATLALSMLCSAQTQEPSFSSAIEVVRAGMQADKATIVTQSMNFSDKDGAVFWPIYRQYEYERSRLDDRRVTVIKEYTQKYPKLSDADAKAMAEQMFDCDSRLATLKKTYFKKFNRVLPALTVTKFFQLDRRIDLAIDMKVESSLPPLTQTQFSELAK